MKKQACLLSLMFSTYRSTRATGVSRHLNRGGRNYNELESRFDYSMASVNNINVAAREGGHS